MSTLTLPDVPRRLWPSFYLMKKIQILTDFENGQVTIDLPRVNWQLSPHASRQFFLVFYMDRLFWAKRWALQLERWVRHFGRAIEFLSLFREKAKWSVGWSAANVLLQSGFRSTIDSPRHFQTSKGTNRNNFYINPDHPRRPQTPLTKFQKIQILTDFDIRQRTLTPTVLIGQLHRNQMRPKRPAAIWMECF